MHELLKQVTMQHFILALLIFKWFVTANQTIKLDEIKEKLNIH